jgi:hypothetical protein
MKNKRNAAGELKPAVLLGDELRVDILAACDQREVTPQEFVDVESGLTLRKGTSSTSPGPNRPEAATAATTGPCDRAS